jgi:hypothetical protein
MEMDKVAVFFAGSILVTMGMVVISAGIILVNNLIHKYWKPVTWLKFQYQAVYFDPKTGEQLVKEEPVLNTKETK